MVTVAAVQLELRDDVSPEQRRHRIRTLVAGLEADLILLPELWEVGPFAVAENLDHAVPLETWVSHMADLAPGRFLHAGSFLERDGDRLFNTSVVFGPDGNVLATYRKIHLFGFDTGEAVTLDAGSDLAVLETPLGTTGLATCYDLRFPEMFRALGDAGASAVLVPTGWPTRRIAHWDVLTRARAVENQMWILGANSVGASNGVELGGHSVLVDPWGVAVGEQQDAGILRHDIDPDLPHRARQDFPVLRDRRL
jgi:predicted amidohydrolase